MKVLLNSIRKTMRYNRGIRSKGTPGMAGMAEALLSSSYAATPATKGMAEGEKVCRTRLIGH